jgi:transcriptional regulator with GAF, ATPase, and Fis domain
LRERPEDIPLLVRYFTDKYARRMGKQIDAIPARGLRKLMRWHWPGNVRELENTVERAVIFTRGNTLDISVPPGAGAAAPAQDRNLDEQERMVRILRGLVERAAMLSPEDSQPGSVPELSNKDASDMPAKAGSGDEQRTILRVLEETKGRVGGANGAAARLGLKRTTLIARMKKLGIDGCRRRSTAIDTHHSASRSARRSTICTTERNAGGQKRNELDLCLDRLVCAEAGEQAAGSDRNEPTKPESHVEPPAL